MIISISIVLLISAFFSGLEIAFVSSNKMLMEMEREDKSLTTRILDRFYRHQNNFITTLLVGNNIALVVYGILMAELIGSNPLVNTLIATVIVLFFGEFLPKTIFRINPNGAMHLCAVPALVFYFILWPISKFTSGVAKLLLRIFGLKVNNTERKNFTKVDLDHLIQSNIDAQEDEEMVEDEVIMFQNALDFSTVRVRDCVVPRTEIIAAPLSASFSQVLTLFIDNGISKLIIYKEDIDDIVGYLHSSEMFRLKDTDDWTKHIRHLPIIPETMPAHKLLSTFISQKKTLAVVVDEFGGTSGIVSLEDLVEEIFGDIQDEHDTENYTAKDLGNGEYLLSGRLEIEKANELFSLNLPESDEYQTVGGFILAVYQSFPKLNEIITYKHFEFKIIETTNTQIKLVRLKITQ
jgi:CBS domain containing-hemolysin-like protein